MSSAAVRVAILGELAGHWTATPYFDLSEFLGVDQLPADSFSPVLLVEFIGGTQRLATIATQGNHGFRETGVGYFHLLMPTGEPSAQALGLAALLSDLFRGKRFGNVVIEAVNPFSDLDGAAIRINGKWHGWTAGFSYYTVTCG